MPMVRIGNNNQLQMLKVQGWLKSTRNSLNTGSFPRNHIWMCGVLKKSIFAYLKFHICISQGKQHYCEGQYFMLSPSLSPLPKFQPPRISESKVFPCLQCVSSDRKNQNIRHSWKRLWILTRALSPTNTGVNFRILPKIFYQNICLIVPCCNTCKDPNGLLHPEWPEIPYMNTSSLGIS